MEKKLVDGSKKIKQLNMNTMLVETKFTTKILMVMKNGMNIIQMEN